MLERFKIRNALLMVLLLLPGHVSAAAAGQQPEPIAIVGATVIPMQGELRLPGHTIIVEDGRIRWLGPDAAATIPANARRIAANGGYVVPGLADMHVHIGETSLPLLLANGVTTARELNGSDDHIRLRGEIARGEVRGPRLFVASTLLTAEEFPVRHLMVTEPAQARELVQRFATGGYDFIKIYDGLSPEVYRAIEAEARRHGLPIVGHIPAAVGLDGVLSAGQSLEHTEKIIVDTMGHAFDDAQLPSIAAKIATAGVWVTPTLASQRALAMGGTPAYSAALARPETRYVGAATRDWWNALAPAADGGTADHPRPGPDGSPFFQIQLALLRHLHAAGVPMIAGSDTPNPLMVPGFSLHDELEELTAAGLSPYDALRMATINAARFAGEPGEFGGIAPGVAADLVLVDEDPLASLRALRHPEAVMVRGEWLDRAELDRMLAEVAAAFGDDRSDGPSPAPQGSCSKAATACSPPTGVIR